MSRFWVPIFVFLALILVGVTVVLLHYVNHPPVFPPITPALAAKSPVTSIGSSVSPVWQMTMSGNGNNTTGVFHNPDFDLNVSGTAEIVAGGNGTVTIGARAKVMLLASGPGPGRPVATETSVQSSIEVSMTSAGDILAGQPQGALISEDRGLKVVTQGPIVSKQITDDLGRHIVTITLSATATYQGKSKDTQSVITITATDIATHPSALPSPWPQPPTIPMGVGYGWQVVVNSLTNHEHFHDLVLPGGLRLDTDLDADLVDYSADGQTATVRLTFYGLVIDSSGHKVAEHTLQMEYTVLVNYLGEIHLGSGKGSPGGGDRGLDMHIDSPQVSSQTTDPQGRNVVDVTFSASDSYNQSKGPGNMRVQIKILAVRTATTPQPATVPAPVSSP